MPFPIKVAIIEDDAKVRNSLSILINGAAGFSCVGAYPNGEAAAKEIPQNWPDVVISDINLPKMSGIDCVEKLKKQNAALQVVMLTAYEDDELIFNSLKAGASGYLLKQAGPSEILDALRDVSNGGSPMTSSIARKVVRFFQQKRPESELDDLSKRELEILTHLAKGYLYKEIGDMLSISALTVRSHLRNIYEKLHVRTRTEAVVKFLEKG